MTVPVYDQVLVFSPEAKTGDPEALHQLAHSINAQGGVAKMVYYGPISRLEINSNRLINHTEHSPMPEFYAHYAPQVLRETKLTDHSLILYPEALTGSSSQHAALWWLSVDNALNADARLRDEVWRNQYFADSPMSHLYQSEYAGDFLRKSGACHVHPLTDYTDPASVERSRNSALNPPISERSHKICFFPSKGAELARDFIMHGNLRHPIDLVPIRGMTKEQVRDTLFSTKIYIDFGHHPGKDRVPREAAIAGAIVLLHAAGSACFYGDHPLDDVYRFTRDDIMSGKLHSLIDEILDNPHKHFVAQQPYRDKIYNEKDIFDAEVRAFFFQ